MLSDSEKQQYLTMQPKELLVEILDKLDDISHLLIDFDKLEEERHNELNGNLNNLFER